MSITMSKKTSRTFIYWELHPPSGCRTHDLTLHLILTRRGKFHLSWNSLATKPPEPSWGRRYMLVVFAERACLSFCLSSVQLLRFLHSRSCNWTDEYVNYYSYIFNFSWIVISSNICETQVLHSLVLGWHLYNGFGFDWIINWIPYEAYSHLEDPKNLN